MDINEHELALLEERLYSNIHHAAEVSKECPGNGSDSMTVAASSAAAKTDARGLVPRSRQQWTLQTKPSNLSSSGGKQKPIGGSAGSTSGGSSTLKKKFTPYQSILTGMHEPPIFPRFSSGNLSNDLLVIESGTTEQRRKKKANGNSANTGIRKFLNPNSLFGKGKIDQLWKLQGKRAKAVKARLKATTNRTAQKVVATIELHSSDDEVRPPKRESRCSNSNDGDPDDVVLIPSAEPPLVCINSSDDDETAKDGFTLPKNKNGKRNRKAHGSRCASPSNSSILSDDFIGQHDRARLNESIVEPDDDWDCNRSKGHRDVSHQQRAPSISSDDTVVTSSDTTDPDKRLPSAYIAAALPVLPVSSANDRSPGNSAGKGDDSIYQAAAKLKKKAVKKVAKASASTEGEQNEERTATDIARNKRSKSLDGRGTKSTKNGPKKRKKQHSEHYSDEDFALMLTDLVHATSEGDDGGSANEMEEEEPIEPQPETKAKKATKESTSGVPVEELNVQPVVDVTTASPSVASVSPAAKRERPVRNVTGVEEQPAVYVVHQNEDQIPSEDPSGCHRDDANELTFLDGDHPECGWNEEMKLFYRSSWNDENFSIYDVYMNMPRASKNWQIVDRDLYPDPPKKQVICTKCREPDHRWNKCSNPRKPSVCYVCGEQGHQEPRCPNALCFNCGAQTRNFTQRCGSCSYRGVLCFICGIRGHTRRSCPDLWRRYHNTIEDNQKLNREYVRNMGTMYCCVCGQRGHPAHFCQAALRIFGQPLATTAVQSYDLWLPTKMQKPQKQVGPRYNFFGGKKVAKVHLDRLMMNEKSFYHRFGKAVGLLEECQQREAKRLRKLAKPKPSATVVTSAHRREPRATVPTNDDNSNYSFSEMLNEPHPGGADKLVEISPLPDYIPLTTTKKPGAREAENATVAAVSDDVANCGTSAKIYLSKPNGKVLLSPDGSCFLKDCSSKHSLELFMSFGSFGHVLAISGSLGSQQAFQNELQTYLETQNREKKLITNVPNVAPHYTHKAINFIRNQLEMLIRPYENMFNLYRRYQSLEQSGHNRKGCEKLRRNLNIVLFGQFGMRDGRQHRDGLMRILENLKTSPDRTVSPLIRDAINIHNQYIFTPYNHHDYTTVIHECSTLYKNAKIAKVTAEELGLVNKCTTPDATDESFGFAHSMESDEVSDVVEARQTAKPIISIRSNEVNGLVLNVPDQMIDPIRAHQHNNEALCGSMFKNRRTPHTPQISKKVKFQISKCRLMLRVLQNRNIKDRFDKICKSLQYGEPPREIKALNKMYMLLSRKINEQFL